MSEATVAATFLVVFREALEASLIIGIVLTVLYRLKASHYVSHVILSAAAALILSLGLGLLLDSLTQSAQGRAEKMIEGLISLMACFVLTYMVFWMDRQGRRIRSDVETHIEEALTKNAYYVMLSLPFFAVLREGAETVLFLKAIAIQSGAVSFWGGLTGLLSAVTGVSFIFIWGKRIPLKGLFRFTGWFILLIAAGLLAYGIHELEELGWIAPLVAPLWDINSILNEKEGIGSFLKALFGYNGNPSLMEVLSYWSYLILIAYLIIRNNQGSHSEKKSVTENIPSKKQ